MTAKNKKASNRLRSPVPAEEGTKLFLQDRQRAYLQLFKKDDKAAEAVIRDLKSFCRADESVFDPNPNIQNMLIGRQEVWLRIKNHIELPFDQLFNLQGGVSNG